MPDGENVGSIHYERESILDSKHIAFFHFGGQCPYQDRIFGDARIIAKDLGWTFSSHDLVEEPELAVVHQIFTPILVIADTQRIIAPMDGRELKQMIVNKAQESWRRFEDQPLQRADRFESLIVQNISRTCWVCEKGYIDIPELNKHRWAHELKEKMGKDFFGYIGGKTFDRITHTKPIGGEIVGVVEILPANLIPYPIPEHDETTAFINCVYSEKNVGNPNYEGDYRQHMLEHAIENLPSEGFEKIQVIAGSTTAHPNGPVRIFNNLGFKERDILQRIELSDGPEEFILLEYDLK